MKNRILHIGHLVQILTAIICWSLKVKNITFIIFNVLALLFGLGVTYRHNKRKNEKLRGKK